MSEAAKVRSIGTGAGEDELAALCEEGRVQGRVYRDPAVFEAEIERIFHRSWVYVAHETEIPEPGDYKVTDIGTQPVIVQRSAQTGAINVMFNRCPHRGALLCDGPGGNAKIVKCPYHGWAFDGDGRLVGVPFKQTYGPSFDQSARGLVHVPRVDSYRGFVFASIAADGPSLLEHLGNAVPYLDQVCDRGVELRAGANRAYIHANWKLQQENSVDNYHLGFVHKAWVDILEHRLARAADEGEPVNTTLITSAPPEWRARDLGNGHGVLDYTGKERSFAGAQPFNLVVFPNLAILGAHVRVTHPVAVDETMVEMFPAMPPAGDPDADDAVLRYHEDFFGPAGFGTPDDVEVVFRRVPLGLAANAVDDWVWFDKGLENEEVGPGGVRSGHITDEAPQRAFYRAWKAWMSGARP